MKRLSHLFKGRVARGSIGSLALQVTEAGLGFLTSLVLARLMGASEFGAYSFAIVLVGFLTIPALLGHNTLAIKQVAALKARSDWSTLRAFITHARGRVLLASAGVTLVGLLLLQVGAGRLESSMAGAVLLGLPLVPLVALLRLYEGYIRGLGHVVSAQSFDKAIRPLTFLFLVALAYLFSETPLNGANAVLLNFASTGVAFLAISLLWYNFRPTALRTASRPFNDSPGWRQAAPFALIASVSILNTQADVLMLGLMTTAEQTGIYRIASRVASLVAFALTAVGATVGPRISSSHARGEHGEVRSLTNKAVLATVAVASPIALGLILSGDHILYLFGNEFRSGATSLSILAIGQLINASMGVVGLLLSMTGYEKLVAKTLIATALLNIALNLVLIPVYGAEGAATATAVTFFVWNLTLAAFVYRKLHFNPTILGAVLWLRQTTSNR